MLCAYFNKLINTPKKDREQVKQKESYPWLDSSDKRKYMTDQEILDKYIDLEGSCLTKEEKKELMEMLYKYKEAFSLRDEIGTCPNIEVEIDVLFYKALPSKRGRQRFNQQRDEKIVLSRYIERRFFNPNPAW